MRHRTHKCLLRKTLLSFSVPVIFVLLFLPLKVIWHFDGIHPLLVEGDVLALYFKVVEAGVVLICYNAYYSDLTVMFSQSFYYRIVADGSENSCLSLFRNRQSHILPFLPLSFPFSLFRSFSFRLLYVVLIELTPR